LTQQKGEQLGVIRRLVNVFSEALRCDDGVSDERKRQFLLQALLTLSSVFLMEIF
jgi:hypothetical protein